LRLQWQLLGLLPALRSLLVQHQKLPPREHGPDLLPFLLLPVEHELLLDPKRLVPVALADGVPHPLAYRVG